MTLLKSKYSKLHEAVITLRVSKTQRKNLAKVAKLNGLTTNYFMIGLIKEQLKKNNLPID